MLKQVHNERGVVLVTALMAMALLTVLGISALNTSDTEQRITGNQRVAGQAFYLAEAGIQRAVGVFRRDGLNVLRTTNFTNQALGGGTYTLTVTDQSTATVDRFLLRSTGTFSGVSKTIEAIYSRARVVVPNPDGAFGIYGNKPVLSLPKNKTPIDGRDWDVPTDFNCNGAACAGTVTGNKPQPGLYVSDTTFANPGQGLAGDPRFKAGGGLKAEDWNNIAQALIPIANKNPASTNLGTRANPTVTYIDNATKFNGNTDGAGILIVEKTGDLKINGTFHYEGIIIVLGSGGLDSFSGTADLFGAVVMVGDNVTSEFKGNGMVKYSSKAIDNVRSKLPPLGGNNPVNRVAWREI